MKTVSVTLPQTFVNLINEITENVSQYIRVAIAKYYLSPEAFEEFRNSEEVTYNISVPIVSLKRYMGIQKEILGETKKVNVKLDESFVESLKKEADERNLSVSKWIGILVFLLLGDVEPVMAYRSLFDKVWLYKFWRDNYDEIHPDDPDQEYHD